MPTAQGPESAMLRSTTRIPCSGPFISHSSSGRDGIVSQVMRSAAIAALLLLLCAPARAEQLDATSLGPAPRDAEGRFLNTAGILSHGSVGVRFPFFLRRMAGQISERPGAPARVANDGAFLRENARHSKPTVTWVGHATLLVQMDHVTFLTDPI